MLKRDLSVELITFGQFFQMLMLNAKQLCADAYILYAGLSLLNCFPVLFHRVNGCAQGYTLKGMDVFEELVRLRRAGMKCALATIVDVHGSVPSHANAKMLIRQDGSIVGTVGGGCVEAEVWEAAREVMDSERPRKLRFSLGHDASFENGLICGGQVEIYVEPVLPQPQLLLFGGGHVSRSISQVATLAGFAVAVMDDREAFANADRFPEADSTLSGEYEDLFRRVDVLDTSYIVIVTRGHRDDMRVLQWAVSTAARYIAMVGSKRKVISTVKELEKLGTPRSLFEKVHAPMGLDIGAITPEEIAVSVVAEMIAVRRDPGGAWRHSAKSVLVREERRSLPQ